MKINPDNANLPPSAPMIHAMLDSLTTAIAESAVEVAPAGVRITIIARVGAVAVLKTNELSEIELTASLQEAIKATKQHTLGGPRVDCSPSQTPKGSS